jgi:hypothetical protein
VIDTHLMHKLHIFQVTFEIDTQLMHKLHIFQVRILWFKNCEVDYFEFCKLWSSSVFRMVSENKRLCRGKDLMHRYGADGHVRKAKRIIRGPILLSNLYAIL